LNNGRFALTLEPQNADLVARMRDVEASRARHAPTIPTTLGLEKEDQSVPAADSSAIRRALNLEAADEVAVFAEMRSARIRSSGYFSSPSSSPGFFFSFLPLTRVGDAAHTSPATSTVV